MPEENDDELDEDEDLFSDTEEDDLFTEEDEEVETEIESSANTTAAPQEAAATTRAAAPSAETKQPITPEQIPVTLIVEVGQVQMTMEQLLKLEPGNLLEIDIHPENGVDLTINGKVVGKGELIRIGEAIGVRVLQLGR